MGNLNLRRQIFLFKKWLLTLFLLDTFLSLICSKRPTTLDSRGILRTGLGCDQQYLFLLLIILYYEGVAFSGGARGDA